MDLESQPKMVGREGELKELKTFLDKAREGHGNTIFIAGEAGVGKTRLLEELKGYAREQGVDVLQGWSLYESLTPYMPFLEALRSGGLENLFADEAPRVEAVYLVSHSGMSIKEVIREETKLDADIFTGMLTAVGDFVQDSLAIFTGDTEKGALNILGYHNYRIIIERFGELNLAVILTGKENEFLIDDMKKVLFNVDELFGDLLKAWDGEEKIIEGIQPMLEFLITSGKYDGIDYAKDDAKIKRNRLFENILLGLQRHVKTTPSLLCIEDLQWVDPSSMALMHYIVRNTRTRNLLILGSYRPEDITSTEDNRTHPLINTLQMMAQEDLYKMIELKRLERKYIDEIFMSFFKKAEFPEEFRNLIYKETEGNPFFIISLFRMLVDENTIEFKDGIWILKKNLKDVHLPSKVYNVIIRRLYRLKEKEREILDFASIIGVEFQSDLLVYATQINRIELLKLLRNLEQKHRMIRSVESKYIFDHSKIKEVCYNQIPLELKEEYHAIIAQTIENVNKENIDDVIGDLAFHFYHCKNQDKALKYLIKAAEKAKNEYSIEEAIEFYTNALELENRVKHKFQLFELLGDLYELNGRIEEGIDSYNEALRLSMKKQKESNIMLKIGQLYEIKGKYDQSLVYYQKVNCQTNDETSKEMADAIIRIGGIHYVYGEYDAALKQFNKGLNIYENIDDEQGILEALNLIGEVYKLKGDLDKAQNYWKESMLGYKRISDSRGIAKCLAFLGICASFKGEFNKSIDYHNNSLKLREKIGDQSGIMYSLYSLSGVNIRKGDYDVALKYLDKCLKKCNKIGDQIYIASCYGDIGIIYMYTEEYEKAIQYLRKCINLYEKTSDTRWIGEYYCAIADVYFRKMELDMTQDFCNKALDLTKGIGQKEHLANIGRIYGKVYREKGMWKESIDKFTESIRIYKEIGIINEIGDTYFEFGLLWRKMGENNKAKEHMIKSLEIYEKLKMEKHIQKVKKELQACL